VRYLVAFDAALSPAHQNPGSAGPGTRGTSVG